MKQTIFLCVLLLSTVLQGYSQSWERDRHHLIFGLGATGFMGELGGADDIGSHGIQGIKDFDFSAIRPAITAGYRYMLFESLGLTGNLTFGYIAGDDKNTSEPFRNNRNIHFRSPIWELSSTLQYYFFSYDRAGARYRRITRLRGQLGFGFSLYVHAGLAGFYFNPQGYFESENYQGTIKNVDDLPPNGWYNLRPLRTEGQGYFPTREKYSRFSLSIPFGIGALFYLDNPDFSIGIEYGFRKTFTDYMDDVSTTYVDPAVFSEMFDDPGKVALAEYFANPTNNSLPETVTAPGQQRGNPFNSDAYMFGVITLYYSIPQTSRPPFGTRRF